MGAEGSDHIVGFTTVRKGGKTDRRKAKSVGYKEETAAAPSTVEADGGSSRAGRVQRKEARPPETPGPRAPARVQGVERREAIQAQSISRFTQGGGVPSTRMR